jgi:hypothetical protein
MLFFQHALADEALARDDFAMIDHLFRDWSPGWTPPPETLAAVKETFRQPGTVAAALGYYRHTMRPVFDDPAQLDGMLAAMGVPLQVPALYLHGADDGCIGAELAHQERPEVVTRLILDFLAS